MLLGLSRAARQASISLASVRRQVFEHARRLGLTGILTDSEDIGLLSVLLVSSIRFPRA